MKKTFEQQSQQYRIARQQDSCPYSDERLAELISLAASGKRSPPAVVPSRQHVMLFYARAAILLLLLGMAESCLSLTPEIQSIRTPTHCWQKVR